MDALNSDQLRGEITEIKEVSKYLSNVQLLTRINALEAELHLRLAGKQFRGSLLL